MNNRKGSAGGKIMAIRQRELALKKYYEHPNICLNCGNIIKVPENKKTSEIRRKKFCDNRCSAIYNNKKNGLKQSRCSDKCIICQKQIILKKKKSGGYYRRNYCVQCLQEIRAKKRGASTFIANLTKDQIMNRYSKYYIGRNMIRKHANNVFNQSNKEKKCAICGYKNHIDVAHIKSVSDYSGDTLISEINHIDNLIGLCLNHHWEYDNAIIDLKGNIL